MKYLAVILTLILTLSAAPAQERHNYLGYEGELLADEVGPYYFIAEGNSTDAFARVDLLANILGVGYSYNPNTGAFYFSQGGRAVTFAATDDVQLGLTERSGTVSVDGETFESPQIILVGEQGYVAINPLVTALGGEVGWDSETRVVLLEFASDDISTASGATDVSQNTTEDVVETSPDPTQPEPTQEVALEKPRLGVHADKTRVALDLPEGTPYTVLVDEATMVIAFPGLRGEAFSQEEGVGAHLRGLGYTAVDGNLALVVQANYPLSPEGQGYEVGLLPTTSERQHEVLYVDFGPGLQGQPAETLQAAPTESQTESQEVRAPEGITHTVVIDPGHGGRDPGAQGYASEEEVVLAISLKVRDILEANGIEVILTRDDDYALQREKRADLAARAELATSDKHNLFMSIHANAAEDANAQGVETWVFGQPLNDTLVSRAVEENGGGAVGAELTEAAQSVAGIEGEVFREEQLSYSYTLANMVQDRMVSATGAIDRGVQKNVFYVIRNARTPAILVETGFVSSPEEGPKLATDAYQNTLAAAIADGVITFFEQGGVFAQQP